MSLLPARGPTGRHLLPLIAQPIDPSASPSAAERLAHKLIRLDGRANKATGAHCSGPARLIGARRCLSSRQLELPVARPDIWQPRRTARSFLVARRRPKRGSRKGPRQVAICEFLPALKIPSTTCCHSRLLFPPPAGPGEWPPTGDPTTEQQQQQRQQQVRLIPLRTDPTRPDPIGSARRGAAARDPFRPAPAS